MAASEIYNRLNHNIRPLLISIEQELQCDASDHPKILKQLKCQCALMQNLREQLIGLRDNDSYSKNDLRHHMIAMEEYILLPLTLILRQKKKRNKVSSASEELDSYTIDLVQKSAEFSCISEAAKTMSIFTDCVFSSFERNNNMEAAVVEPKIFVSCLTSCAFAIEYVHNRSNINPSNTLDHGHDCEQMILRTIYDLLQLVVSSKNTSSVHYSQYQTLSTTLMMAMDGSLVAQLTQGCIYGMSPQNQKSAKNTNEKKIVKQKYFGLQLQALNTLQSLINVVPFEDTWRALFPGTYSGVFRLASSSLQSFQSSPKLVQLSLNLLCDLLTITLSTSKRQENIKRSNKISTSISHEISTKTNEANIKDITEINTSQTFEKEIMLRVPGPLCILIHHVSNHRSKRIRENILGLCEIILFDTRNVWKKTKPSVQELKSFSQSKKKECEDKEETIILTALEACLVLSGDEHELVAFAAKELLRRFCSILNYETDWRDYENNIIAPRIVKLIEDLPALTLSTRETNTRNRLELLNGYFSISLNFERNTSRNSNLRARSKSDGSFMGSSIGSSLASGDIFRLIRSSFTTILELDFESFSHRIPQGVIYPKSEHSYSKLISFDSSYNFLHLRNVESVRSVIKFLRLLGCVLGEKRCAFFLDECISLIFDECVDAERCGMAFHGKGQFEWLRRRVSFVIMMKEMLVGCISSNQLQEEWNFSEVENILTLNASTAQIELFTSVCISILPIIIDTSIWNLPTTVEISAVAYSQNDHDSEDDNKSLSHFFHSPLNSCKSIALESKGHTISRKNDFVEVSAATLHGNAHLLAQFLDMIGILSLVLSNRVQSLLPIILFPMVEKTNIYGNHSYVREAAFRNLNRVAKAVGAKDISELFLANFDYLVDSIISRIQVQEKEGSISKDSSNHNCNMISTLATVEILLDCTFCQLISSQLPSVGEMVPLHFSNKLEQHEKFFDERNRKLFHNLIQSLLSYFDHKVSPSMNRKISSTECIASEGRDSFYLAMVRVLGVTLKSLKVSCKQIDHKRKPPHSDGFGSEPWFENLLSNFVKNVNTSPQESRNTGNLEDNSLTPYEGFAIYHAKKDSTSNKDLMKDSNDNSDEHGISPKPISAVDEATNQVLKAVNTILSRSSFFLSVSNLKANVAACETIIDGFELLVEISEKENLAQVDSETNHNFLLPSVSEIWPDIRFRLSVTSISVINTQTPYSNSWHNQAVLASNVDLRSNAKKEAPSLAFFICSLLKLIASICELSGDFMANRFKADVWPIMSSLLCHYMRVKKSTKEDGKILPTKIELVMKPSKTYLKNRSTCRPESDLNIHKDSLDTVIVSVLECLTRVFSTRDLGSMLIYLIPEIGNLILPLLCVRDAIGNFSELVMQSMLKIDCSPLLRGLISLSDQQMPLNPFQNISKGCLNVNHKNIHDNTSRIHHETITVTRAKRLLRFLDDLGEQNITS